MRFNSTLNNVNNVFFFRRRLLRLVSIILLSFLSPSNPLSNEPFTIYIQQCSCLHQSVPPSRPSKWNSSRQWELWMELTFRQTSSFKLPNYGVTVQTIRIWSSEWRDRNYGETWWTHQPTHAKHWISMFNVHRRSDHGIPKIIIMINFTRNALQHSVQYRTVGRLQAHGLYWSSENHHTSIT